MLFWRRRNQLFIVGQEYNKRLTKYMSNCNITIIYQLFKFFCSILYRCFNSHFMCIPLPIFHAFRNKNMHVFVMLLTLQERSLLLTLITCIHFHLLCVPLVYLKRKCLMYTTCVCVREKICRDKWSVEWVLGFMKCTCIIVDFKIMLNHLIGILRGREYEWAHDLQIYLCQMDGKIMEENSPNSFSLAQ